MNESSETLTVTGTAMRSKVYDYPESNVKAMKHREALLHAAKFSKWAPITLGHTVSTSPLPGDPIIGGFTATGVTEDGRLRGEYEFLKERTPATLLDALRRGERIRTSTGFDYLQGEAGQGYDYSQDKILMKHVAVFLPSNTRVKPRCTIGEGCGVGLDGVRVYGSRLISYDAQYLGVDNPMTKPDQDHQTEDATLKPVESDKPPCPPPAAKDSKPTITKPSEGDKPVITSDASLDALKALAIDLDPSLKGIVEKIDSPEAIQQLASRAKDSRSAGDAALPVGTGASNPLDLGVLRKKQVDGIRQYHKDTFRYTHNSYKGDLT